MCETFIRLTYAAMLSLLLVSLPPAPLDAAEKGSKTEVLPIQKAAPAGNAYEIHKLADGSGMLVGFIGQDLMPQVTPIQRPKTVRLALYSNPNDKAPHIVSVPLIKLSVDRMPVPLDPKKVDSPVKLEMDLQSTVNRKTPTMAQ